MKVEGYLFAGVAVFLIPVTTIYWFYSEDPTGTTALAVSFGLAALISIYLFVTARRIEPRPEDNLDAEIADGAGDLGFFSPHSWWPLALAASLALATLGVVFGWWLLIAAVPFVTYAAMGFVFEYYRGEHQH